VCTWDAKSALCFFLGLKNLNGDTSLHLYYKAMISCADFRIIIDKLAEPKKRVTQKKMPNQEQNYEKHTRTWCSRTDWFGIGTLSQKDLW